MSDALNDFGLAIRRARILVLGVTYKEDVEDMRNSPAISVIEWLRAKCAHVRYHDPFVPRFQVKEEDQPPAPHRDLRADPVERRQNVTTDMAQAISEGRRRTDPLESCELTDLELEKADCVLVITAHSAIDYDRVARKAQLIVDTRNVIARQQGGEGARIIPL